MEGVHDTPNGAQKSETQYSWQQWERPDSVKRTDGNVMSDKDIIKLICPTAEGLVDPDDSDDDNDHPKTPFVIILKSLDQVCGNLESSKGCEERTPALYYRVRQFVLWCERLSCRPIPNPERVSAYLFQKYFNKSNHGSKTKFHVLRLNIFALQDAQNKLRKVTGLSFGDDVYKQLLIRQMLQFAWAYRKKQWNEDSRQRVLEYLDPGPRNLIAHLLTQNIGEWMKFGSRVAAGIQMFFREDDGRYARLCDFSPMEVKPSDGLLISLIGCRRHDKSRKRIYGFAVRHKDPTLCPHGWLARYLFYRYRYKNEQPPVMSTNEDWSKILMWPGEKSPKSETTFGAQLVFIKSVVGAINSHSSSILDVFAPFSTLDEMFEHFELVRPGFEASMPELGQVYIDSLGGDVQRAAAGFEEKSSRKEIVERARVEPPKSMINATFPFISELQISVDEMEMRRGLKEEKLAAKNLLSLFQYLGKVLLQDAVFMREVPMFNRQCGHELFRGQEFNKFVKAFHEPGRNRSKKVIHHLF